MRNLPPCSSLLLRIHHQRLEDARNKHLKNIKKHIINLFIYFLLLLIFQCHNRIYNSLKGPFPMNLKQFHDHLETNYNLFGYKSLFSFHWFRFQLDYIQLDLGENKIDENNKNSLRVFYGHHSHGQLLYKFHHVIEPSIDTSSMQLYIKFNAYEQSDLGKVYSYDFQSFSIKTLRCIVRELTISPTVYMKWFEKSLYVEKIKEMYNEKAIFFNKNVISKCGILIGYLYQPRNEYVCLSNSFNYRQFNDNVRIFDTSSSYIPYISYIFVSLFIYFLYKTIQHISCNVNQLIHTSFPLVDDLIRKQLIQSNINSLEGLDELLSNTPNINNYHNRLFILQNNYLVILEADLQETNQVILQQFYENPPLIIISIDNIRYIKSDCVILIDCHQSYIDFTKQQFKNHFNLTNWLHERLMDLSDRYRYDWEQEEAQRIQEEQYRHLLETLSNEEAEYQSRHYRNDINRILYQVTSASPRFIAQFRLNNRLLVDDALLDTTCTICLENFQLNEFYAEWPCPGRHVFHFNCMLKVLRERNTCPLCRSPVEAAALHDRDLFFRLIVNRITPNVFT
ncbi:unnamed protein product [Adineta steineri]|uniref:RING-type domain-containing protein n=1 Tax=Adineta steineri TaxID=433720 RepID=A0A815V115_9BILA|nr:unnamed protein product [Adineta steineri]CAF1651150.1 unnamed protein product [Adineta steineri]